jgi:hypothetical protein
MQLDTSSDLPPWSPRIVYIRAAVSGLDSPIVPFAVLKHDPRPGKSFEQEPRRIFSGQPESADAVREWWDAPLHALAADRRYFLLAWSAIEGASPRIVPMAGLAFGIATPGPSNKRWITTSALEYHGELVAWCEEIDMSGVQEDIIEVVLSEEHMIRLLPGDADGRVSKVA